MSDSAAMEQYPPLPTATTHKVDVNSRLALRNGPAYLSSSDSASMDNHIKGEIVEMLPNGTELIVLDEGVGHECAWAQVLVVGKTYPNHKKLFVKRVGDTKDFIKKISGISESAPYECGEKSVGKPSALPIVEWTTKPTSLVMFDEQSAEYKVSVELSEQGFLSTGGTDISNRLEQAALIGLGLILKSVGKSDEESYLISLMEKEYFQFVRAPSYFVDTKAHTYLKVLVTLPHRYVPPLEDATGIVETAAGRSLTAWDMAEKVKLRATYKTEEFNTRIESLASLLEEYAVDIDNYDGTIIDYDARVEAERIRLIPSQLTKLFKSNQLSHDPFSKAEVLEIGWDKTLTPVLVSLTTSAGATIAMGMAMDEFADSPPIDSQRTQGYLWQLNLMSAQTRDDRPWTEFVNSFTLPDAPAIIPGAKGSESAGDISDNESAAKKASSETDALPIKTYMEKLSEDRKLGNLDFKSKLYEDRKNAYEFVGSSVASCEGLQKTLDKINTIDDAFGEVLDKISIADLIKQCMDVISPNLTDQGGIGLGDIPDVNLDYDWSLPNAPSLSADLNMPDLGSMSISTFNLGSVNFSQLGLSSMSFEDLNISSMDLGSLGLSGMTIGSLGIGSMTMGELGLGSIDFGSLNIGSINLSDIDFGDFTVGDLGLDLCPFTVASLGMSDTEIGDFGLTISDLGITKEQVAASGVPVEVTDTSMSHLTFSDLQLDDTSACTVFESVGIDIASFKMVDIGLDSLGTLSSLPDIDLSVLSIGSLPDLSIGDLGLDGFSIGDLNLTSLPVGDFGLDSINLDDLGLGNINMSALGLGDMDIDGLKTKFDDLGLSGVKSALDAFNLSLLENPLGAIPDVSTDIPTDVLDTQFSEELSMAKKKLEKMTGKAGLSDNPFEQGEAPRINSMSIVLPDNLPTEDIMASLGDAIEGALTSFLTELFVAMVKQVLSQMIDSCGQEPEHAGKENLNTMLDDSPNNTNQTDPLSSLMAALGVGVTGAGLAAAKHNPNSEAARAAITPSIRKKMNDMLDDVSLVFTPMELCSLINGKASNKVVLLARNLILKKYPDMNLSTRTKVTDFFKAFGKLIDPSICRVIEEPATTAQSPILGDLLCGSDEMNDLRREILRNKGDDITEDQIDALLKKARQRKVNAAKLLADMVNKGPLSDDYEPPPVVCQKGGDPRKKKKDALPCADGTASPVNSPEQRQAPVTPGSNVRPGLVELSHESIDFAMDKCIENTFTPLEISFSNDMRTYPKVYSTKTDETEAENVDVFIQGGWGDDGILNPIISEKFGSREVAKSVIGDQSKYSVSSRIRKAMPSLYQALRNMETNDALEFQTFPSYSSLFNVVDSDTIDNGFSFEDGGYGIKMLLPNPAQDEVANIKSEMSSLDNDTVKGTISGVLAQLEEAAPKWCMYYILPNLTDWSEHNNQFLTIVTETKLNLEGVETENIVYRKLSDVEVSEDVAGFLDNLTVTPETSSDFVFGPVLGTIPIAEDASAGISDSLINRLQWTFDDPSSCADPKYKFASLVCSTWAEAGIGETQSLFDEVVKAGGVYSELSRDIFSYIAQRIANSAYFHNISPANESSGPTKMSSSIPVVELLELDPEPTAEQLNGVDPHPLGMKQKKKCLKEAVKNQCLVDIGKPTDGSPAGELSDTEKQMMNLCVESAFRVYMIDYYLRSIFTNSVFKMSTEPDEAYMSHMTGFILSDLQSYDTPAYVTHEGVRKQVGKWGTYEEDFINEVVRMYEPEEGVEPSEESEADIESFYTINLAFQQQIKKQYTAVKVQMDSLVAGRNATEIEKQFVEKYLPRFEITDYGSLESKFFKEGSVDWSKTVLDALLVHNTSTGGASFVGTFDSLAAATGMTVIFDGDDLSDNRNSGLSANTIESSESLSSIEMSDINFENGNLYLEEYYEVEDWDWTSVPDWWWTDEAGFFRDRGQKFDEETNPEYYKYFGVMTKADYEKMVSHLPAGVSTHSNQAYFVASIPGSVLSAPKNMFKSVKKGVRIMYLPPSTSQFVVTKKENDSAHSATALWTPTPRELFNWAWEASRTSASPSIFSSAANGDIGNRITREKAVMTKAYKIIEMVDSLTHLAVGDVAAEGTIQTYEAAANTYLFRETNPFPVVDIKKNVEPVSTDAQTGVAPISTSSVGFGHLPTDLTSTPVLSMQDELFTSTEFKALTEYFFPISRYKSILSLYSFQTVSSRREVATAMSESKDKLRTIFFAINSKGDYKQKDPAMEAVGGEAGLSRMIQNEFGVKDMPASDNSWNYNMPVGWGKPVKGLGFDMVAKATAEASQKIFKQWVEKNDPNISLAHKLAIVSKMANLNIPTLAWSFMVLPANVFPPMMGPPLGPAAIVYHALGLGLWKRVKGAKDGTEDESGQSSLEKQLAALGVDSQVPSPPTDCDDNWDERNLMLSTSLLRALNTSGLQSTRLIVPSTITTLPSSEDE